MRLDKMLSSMAVGSRKDIKKLVKEGRISINGVTAQTPDQAIDEKNDVVLKDGVRIVYKENIYIMMNKPQGVVSATEDNFQKTVIDILPDELKGFKLFPVGRLDIDTEGLMILTTDGDFAHKLLSPKAHIAKTYYALIEGVVSDSDIEEFKRGVVLEDYYKTLPAELIILEKGENFTKIELTIYEGKFHQVKRMFKAVGKKVKYLKRLAMGGYYLPETLAPGEIMEITDLI